MMRTTTFAIGATAVVALAATASLIFNSQGSQDSRPRPCGPVTLLTENFDSVTPPALPPGWSSITWVTSNSGVPAPPADTLPNAAFVDDPASFSDKQLVSPSIFLISPEPVQVAFRNNFNLQAGFDGGVLELSTDGGNTFQDILAFGEFATGGYNGTITPVVAIPSLAVKHGPETRIALSRRQ